MAQTSKQYLTTLTIIHTTLFMMQITFGAIAFFLKSKGMFQNNGQDINDVLLIAATVVAVAGIAASTFIGKARMSAARQKPDLRDKLSNYKTALLIKLALLEMPTVFILVCFLLTGSFYLLGFAGAILILFFINRPTVNNLVMDLELSQSDKSLIENPNSIVD